MGHHAEGNDRIWNLIFSRNFHDWELEAVSSFLDFIYSQVPSGMGSDRLCWCLMGSGTFDTLSFYQEIRGALYSIFPWKCVWKVKVTKRVAFFMCTTALCQILTLDNLMGRGLPLVNQCCMCCYNGESVDHLLHCDIAYALWINMI